MLEATLGPLIRLLCAGQNPTDLARGTVHLVAIGHPVGDLTCGPDLLARCDFCRCGPDLLARCDFCREGSNDFRREGRGLTRMRLIGQRLEAAGQELLDPVADADLTLTQIASNPRNGEAHIGKAHHFQAITSARQDIWSVGPALQLDALFVRQVDAIHPTALLPDPSTQLLCRPA